MEKYTVVYVHSAEEYISLYKAGHDYFRGVKKYKSEIIKELSKYNDQRSRFHLAMMLDDKEERFKAAQVLMDEGYLLAFGYVGSLYQQKGEYKKAYEILSYGYLHEDVDSAFYYALMYDQGLGVKQDKIKARQILENLADKKRYCKAACYLADMMIYDNPTNYEYIGHYLILAYEIGSPLATDRLARAYFDGVGMPRDYEKARELFEILAEQDNAKACVSLGYIYDHAKGVERDIDKAFKYFKKAAELNNAIGCYDLALFYYEGWGCEQNYKEALNWFLKSVELGETLSYSYIGDIYFHGYGVPVDYVKASEWYLKAGDDLDSSLLYGLGNLYYDGLGVEKDRVKALDYYRQAASQGHKEAQYKYASMKEAGIACIKDIKTAYKYYAYASIQGHGPATDKVSELEYNYDLQHESYNLRNGWYDYDVASQLYKSKTTVNHYERAFEYFESSIKKGYTMAYYMLGVCYRNGNGAPLDIAIAIECFENVDLTNAKLELAELYLFGIGVKKDYKRALEYLKEAGSEPLKFYYLGYMYEHGLGVEKDLNEAFKQYEMARDKGIQAAISRLESADYQEYANKEKIKDLITQLQSTYAYTKERLDILLQIYDLGVRSISYYIGEYYLGKKEPEYQKALEYFLEAYDLGNKDAPAILGKMYLEGLGVSPNYEIALKYINEALKSGSVYATYLLSICYEQGLGVKQDTSKALELLKEAASKKEPQAMYKLGVYLFDNGKFVEAFELLNNREVIYTTKASIYIGRIYEIKGEMDKALESYKQAIAMRYFDAYSYLINLLIKQKKYDDAYYEYTCAIEDYHVVDMMIDLAAKLYKGEVFKKNHTLSEMLYKMALEQGDKRAESALKSLTFKKSLFDKKKL